jgi:predicted RNA-binding protein with PIN domain
LSREWDKILLILEVESIFSPPPICSQCEQFQLIGLKDKLDKLKKELTNGVESFRTKVIESEKSKEKFNNGNCKTVFDFRSQLMTKSRLNKNG